VDKDQKVLNDAIFLFTLYRKLLGRYSISGAVSLVGKAINKKLLKTTKRYIRLSPATVFFIRAICTTSIRSTKCFDAFRNYKQLAHPRDGFEKHSACIVRDEASAPHKIFTGRFYGYVVDENGRLLLGEDGPSNSEGSEEDD